MSGYRLLPRWLAARAGMKVDAALTRDIRDLVGRIGELIDLFARADSLLVEALDCITRRRRAWGEDRVGDEGPWIRRLTGSAAAGSPIS